VDRLYTDQEVGPIGQDTDTDRFDIEAAAE
jgi:hypothetical protein